MEAKAKGVDFLYSGSNDPATQVNDMNDYLGEKVDALAASPLDADAAIGIVKQAKKDGIPVVSVHGQIPGAPVSAAIAIDFPGIGVTMGQQIVQYCKKFNPCRVGLFVGSRGDDASVQVQTGVQSQLKNDPNIQVVANPGNGFDPSEASSATTDVLTKYPNINVLWYVWSAGDLAGIQAVKTAGLTGKVAVFSGSGTCQMLQDDLNGTEQGDVMLFTQVEGKDLIDTAAALANHQSVPAVQTVPTYPLTPTTAKEVLNGTLKLPASVSGFATSELKQAASGKCPS